MHIDIHAHKAAKVSASAITVENVYRHFDALQPDGLYSAGLHPWYLENSEQQLLALQQAAQNVNVIAIGECGLDRSCTTDWQLQINVFRQQVALANDLDKPLILHCVRAFDEVIQLLEHVPATIPVIFHGYNNKAATADRLIAKGYYLSFGAAVLRSSTPAARVLSSIPGNRFFLETDDTDVAIADIYQNAAQLRNCATDDIILQVQNNFTTVFKR